MSIKHEFEIKDELLHEMDDDETNGQIYVMSGLQEISKKRIFNSVQNHIEEDEEEKGDVLERKSSLGSGHQELRRGNKDTETHDWKNFCCSNCNFSFESEDELMSHLESFCKGKVKCSRCISDCNCTSDSKMYSSKHGNIDKNILKVKSFKCSECCIYYKQKHSLKMHMLTHQNIKLFKCSECDYKCNRKLQLKTHLLKHQNIKLFNCSKCGFECNEKRSFKRHMLRHQNLKLFKCSECDHRCNEKGNLKKHILKHRNIILFKCSECDYGCRTKNDLGKHMLTHQNIKLFKCSECDYKCNQKVNLKTHMLKHRNIKLFKCSECEYECNYKGSLKRHILKH